MARWRREGADLPATLMAMGGLLGFAVTAPYYRFGFGLLANGAFAVVFLGALASISRSPSHRWFEVSLAAAFLGGMASVGIVWFLPGGWLEFPLISGSMGILGMTISMIGARLGLMGEAELGGRGFLNSDQVGALLLCGGGTLGLIGSPATVFFFALLPLASFVVVLLLGIGLLGVGSEGRILAVVALYFGIAGSGAFVFILPAVIGGWVELHWFLLVTPTATVITSLGAGLRILRATVPHPAVG